MRDGGTLAHTLDVWLGDVKWIYQKPVLVASYDEPD